VSHADSPVLATPGRIRAPREEPDDQPRLQPTRPSRRTRQVLAPTQPPNKSPDVKILFRWALKGLSGVRLQTVRVEGRVCSTVRWLAEFLRKTGADRVHRMRQAVYEYQRPTVRAADALDRRDGGSARPTSPFPRGGGAAQDIRCAVKDSRHPHASEPGRVERGGIQAWTSPEPSR